LNEGLLPLINEHAHSFRGREKAKEIQATDVVLKRLEYGLSKVFARHDQVTAVK
jgi:hypothetical protein